MAKFQRSENWLHTTYNFNLKHWVFEWKKLWRKVTRKFCRLKAKNGLKWLEKEIQCKDLNQTCLCASLFPLKIILSSSAQEWTMKELRTNGCLNYVLLSLLLQRTFVSLSGSTQRVIESNGPLLPYVKTYMPFYSFF